MPSYAMFAMPRCGLPYQQILAPVPLVGMELENSTVKLFYNREDMREEALISHPVTCRETAVD